MIKRVISAVIGTRHERERRRIQPIVDAINGQGERLRALSDDQLRAQTDRFRGIVRDRAAEIEAKVADLKERKHHATDSVERDTLDTQLSGAETDLRKAIAETLDEILPEAFATVRE